MNMKKLAQLFVFILAIQISSVAQVSLVNEALTLKNQKALNLDNPNCFFFDKTKVIQLPADGGFLYSSLESTENSDVYGYNNNEDFVVTIKNPYGRKIFFKSQYFITDKNDVLKIYDGKDMKAPLIQEVSGTISENFLVLSSGEYLTLHFKSDNQITSKGFRFRMDNGPVITGKSNSPLPNPSACASTPASDECVNAPLICDLSGYCGNTSSAYTAGNTSGLGSFCGSIENNSWLSFIASSTAASLGFTSSGCQSSGSGIQATIYASSNCSSFTQVANCISQGSASGSFTITTNVSLVPGQTYYVMVDGYAGNVCNYSVTAQSGVALTPQLSGPNQVCPGNSAILGSSTPAASYSWTSTPPGVYPSSQTISVSPTVTTTYTLTLGTSGCAPAGSQAVKTVTVTSTLDPANITAPNPVCLGANVTLSSLTNGGTFLWTGPNSYTSTSQNATVSNWSAANNGTYTLVIDYGPGCSTSPATVSTSAVAAPIVALASNPSPPTICSGQSITLTASGGASGNNPYNWNWNLLQTSATLQTCLFPGICTNNPVISFIPGAAAGGTGVFTPTQNTQICVSSTNANGCTGQACINVVLSTAGSLTVSPSTSVCPGQSTTLTVTGGSSYTWTPAASLNSANGASVIATPTANTIYTVTGQTCGSTVTRTVEVVISNNLIVSVNSPSICPGQTATLTATGANTYTWSTLETTPSITVAPSSQTIYTVSGEITGCSGSQTSTVTIVQQPTISVANTTICAGSNGTLSATGATNYTWTPGLINGANIIVSPTTTTTYTITGDEGACSSSTTAIVTVSANPTITVNSSTVCAGQPSILTASGATTYSWSTGANTSTISVSPSAAQEYTVIGVAATCEGIGTATVSVIPSPSISFTADNSVACGSLCVNFTDNTSASCTSISYNFGDGGSANSNNPNHCFNLAGNYTVTATCTDAALGCSTTYTLPTVISVIAQPVANFNIVGGDVFVQGSIVDFENQSLNGASSVWLLTCPGSTLTTTDASTSALDVGRCCATLVSINNTCSDTISKCYTVVNEPMIIIPNVFTPNNDNRNDVFKITGSGIKSLKCVIYNRWGLKMYEWEGISGGWNGNVKSGASAPDGTYFYILEYTDIKDKKEIKKDFFTLFRD